MEATYNLQLNYIDNDQNPFSCEFLTRIQSMMVNAIELEFSNMNSNTNIDLNTPGGQTELSIRSTARFKERVRFLLEDFLAHINFHINIQVAPREACLPFSGLSNTEYNQYIIKHRGTKKTRKALKLNDTNITCPICLEDLKDNRIWHGPKCNHLFHPKCLQKYLKKNCASPQCPVCRMHILV